MSYFVLLKCSALYIFICRCSNRYSRSQVRKPGHIEFSSISNSHNIPLEMPIKSTAQGYTCIEVPLTTTLSVLSSHAAQCVSLNRTSMTSCAVGNKCTVLANVGKQDIESEGQYMPWRKNWARFVSQFCSLQIGMALANCGHSLLATADHTAYSRIQKASRFDTYSTRKCGWHSVFSLSGSSMGC